MKAPHKNSDTNSASGRNGHAPKAMLLSTLLMAALLSACGGSSSADDRAQIDQGRQTFRFDTFGDETLWTDKLRMHEVIASAVDPTTALSVGLKVDAEALPATVVKGILDGTISLKSPATTVALIKLNVRKFDAGVRTHVRAAIVRIVNAEAEASGAPRKPEITSLDHYPLNVNDADASDRVATAFRRYFSPDRVRNTGPAPASEDFGCFGTAWKVPSVFWFVGGTDPQKYAEAEKAGRLNDLPSNHSPQFAPVINPTLRVGIETMLAAAGPWLASASAKR